MGLCKVKKYKVAGNCNVIVVNATAMVKSGALTILVQFLEHANNDSRYHYVCFVPKDLHIGKYNNVTLIEVEKMGWIRRIFWDAYQLRLTIKRMKISPSKVISLQNTSVNVPLQQIIYLHQSLPFSEVKWNFFIKEQRSCFLYKHFYKFFILLFSNKNTIFVVQTNWMKNALCATSNVKENKVYVIKPDLSIPVCNNTDAIKSPHGSHVLLYPATPLFYKNHSVILKALNKLIESNIFKNITFQVTFSADEYPSFTSLVNQLCLEDNIQYLGTLNYEDLIKKYKDASIVLFPSMLESFGLPLAEGAVLKKPIICSDLPYARDVLDGYLGAVYVNCHDSDLWAKEICLMLEKIEARCFKVEDFHFKQTSSWDNFFELL